MDNFDVKFEETLSAFNVHPSETNNSFNAEGDSVIVIPQGGEGKIQSILVNGEEQPIVDKKVDIKVPTKTSQLENDSDFATTNDIPTKVSDLDNDSKFVNEETLERTKQELKDYVDETEKVGDINVIEGIKVNGSKLTPNSQKEVDIVIPTKTSDLLNDSDFATNDDIKNEISKLVNSAPSTLDTLGKIANALKNNANIVDTLDKSISDKVDKKDLSKVATSGSYNDLSNKPTIPSSENFATKQSVENLQAEVDILKQQGGNPNFEEIIPAQNIELAVGQTFDNQEVIFYLNWSGVDTPEGSIGFDVGELVNWYFATSDPYITINGTTYYQSQGITEVETTLNGTITNIDSHAYGGGFEIPLTNVITKVTTKGSVVEDLLVRTKDGAFGYTKISNIISGGKVIHITKYTAENIIGFSMQGYSHFQILSGKTDNVNGHCEMLGMVASKNDSAVNGSGHKGATGYGYWQDLVIIPMTYNESGDFIYLDVSNSPLVSNDGNMDVTGLSVYIRLFNIEKV